MHCSVSGWGRGGLGVGMEAGVGGWRCKTASLFCFEGKKKKNGRLRVHREGLGWEGKEWGRQM